MYAELIGNYKNYGIKSLQGNKLDLATWVSYVDDNSGVDRTLTKAIVDKAYDQANEGEDGPSLGIMDKSVFTKFKGLLTAQQRVGAESSFNGMGHKGIELMYNGINHILENQMPAKTLFYVDENTVKFHVQKDNNMRIQQVQSLENKDAQLHRVFLYAAVVGKERKYSSRVNDIDIA